MKKILSLLFVLFLVILLTACEEKNDTNIILEGKYDFVENILEDGTKITRDDIEEEKIFVDSLAIDVWNNNTVTYGWLTSNNKSYKSDMLVTNEYFINKEDKDDKIQYKYSTDKLELNFKDNHKEIYIKDYQKKLDEKYQNMIGHYEIISWLDKGKENVPITNEIKKTIYLDIFNNKKAQLTGYYSNSSNYTINSKHFYSLYSIYSHDKFDYTYDNGKIILVNYQQTEITFKKINN